MFLNKRHFYANGFSTSPLALLWRRLFWLSSVALVAIVFVFLFGPSVVLNRTFAAPEPWWLGDGLVLNLSIAGGSNVVSLNIASLDPNGIFRTSDTSSNISVATNNFTGYTLGIAAKTDYYNSLYSSGYPTYEIPSITSSVSAEDYADDAYAETNNLNNTWGYRPSTLYDSTNDTNVSNTDYLPAPDDTADQTIIAKTHEATRHGPADEYNIAIGARIDSSTPPGNYTNTFVITAVANSIPYTITYNANDGHDGQDTTNMPVSPEQEIVDATTPTITLPSNVPTRSGYIFKGWCTVQVADDASCPSGANEYQPGDNLPVDYTIDNIALYARWAGLSNITFTAGNNIEVLMVADSSENYKPYYIATGESKTFTNAIPDTKYIVTVVPEANYKLDSWSGSDKGLAGLESDTLLTTNYIVPASTTATLTATGTSGTYDNKMKDLTLASCPASGINVTDERDNKSYTVANISGYCYMLSNLRLDSGITLDSTYSDINPDGVTYEDPTTGASVTATTFTTPTEDWTRAAQNYYCKAIMKHYNQNNGSEYRNEYYYNWYAAMANPYQCADPTSYTNATATNDGYSLGSICPKNWTLPTYQDITPANIWDSSANPGMLATTGYFIAGFQNLVGYYGYQWSSSRNNNEHAHYLQFDGTSANRHNNNYAYLKYSGFSVRCMRSS